MNLPPGGQGVGSLHEYEWTIPNAVSGEVRVRVRMDNAGTNYEDISNADFSIVRPLAGDLNCDGTFNGAPLRLRVCPKFPQEKARTPVSLGTAGPSTRKPLARPRNSLPSGRPKRR